MKGFKSAWWWQGRHTPAIDKREIIGFVPMTLNLLGSEVNSTSVILRGGGMVVMDGTVEYVTAQIFGQWPPDAPEEVDPVPTGTKQPLETMNVSGPALAADIEAAWQEALQLEKNVLPDQDAASFRNGSRVALRLLSIRLGIEVALSSPPEDDAGVKEGQAGDHRVVNRR